MTLKQAFTIWAATPKNTVLAARYRESVQRVLMKKWNDIDMEQVTEAFAKKVFSSSTESQEMKSRAASVLVQLLEWGAENGHCRRPTFTYNIASACQTPQQPETPKSGEPLVKVKPEALAKRKAELESRNEPKREITMEQKKTAKRGRAPRPFAQIDPMTFEVVKVWPTMKEAERALGACNIDRASRLIRKSSGYYWSDAADAATFKERLDAKIRGVKPDAKKATPKSKKTVVKASPAVQVAVTTDPTPSSVTHRNPSEGQVRNAAHDALEAFSDDMLIEELDRRGWWGEIRKTQIVTIGTN